MTAHSGRGQGDESLYEGVVLPANGEPWTPEQQRQVAQSQVQLPSGQPWGQPWGPESQAAAGSTEYPAPTGGPTAPPAPPGPPPLPSQAPPVPQAPPAQPSAPPHSGAQPPGAGGEMWGGGHASYGAQLPPQAPQAPQSPAPENGTAPEAGTAPGPGPMPGPAQAFAGDSGATQMLPPQQPGAQAYGGPQALPDYGSAADATQHIPQVSGHQQGQSAPMPGPGAAATQMLPPQPGPGQNDATAALRSPLPPESRGAPAAPAAPYGMSQGNPGIPQQPPPQQPQPLHQQPPPQQPQPEQQREPLAEFDSLFRAESPPVGPDSSNSPGSTQSLPLFDRAAAHQQSGGPGGPPAYGQSDPYGQGGAYGHGAAYGKDGPYEPQGRAARRNAERGGSRMSPGVLIAIGVVLVAGLGVAAGAAFTGGGFGGDDKKDSSGPSAGAKDPSGSGSVTTQARQLDKLLDDSNNSRTTVIRSVENIKSCQKLGQAASDLHAAAGQRNGLVSRLGKLETGKLPDSSQLTSSLARAWKSSAAADDHYAAWAGQAASKKGCHKGRARMTSQVAAGARSSGEATTAKKQAAGLWNPTARKYGLKQRQFGQL